MQVRHATPADTPALLAMGAKFYATTSYNDFAQYDERTVDGLIDLMRDGVLLVAEIDGVAVGVVGLMVAPFIFNDAHRIACEVIWWVDPGAQGAGAGKALLFAIEPVCRARGLSAIQMVHLSNSPPQAAALYERMGYWHTESSYTKVL
ncbi:N-acetyltransferase family protein [Lysobacter sp. Hz 25]|uniref:GNAT family N-acetyltransferase n=1 Tax=Lysobacter sp. Hz 25 TaxID=3383698 RepID=UPI0038D3D5DD